MKQIFLSCCWMKDDFTVWYSINEKVGREREIEREKKSSFTLCLRLSFLQFFRGGYFWKSRLWDTSIFWCWSGLFSQRVFTGSACEDITALPWLLGNRGMGNEEDTLLLMVVRVFKAGAVLHLWQDEGRNFGLHFRYLVLRIIWVNAEVVWWSG